MLNKTTRLLGLVALGVLTGCGGGGGGGEAAPAEATSAVVSRLQTNGTLLTLDRTATVAGSNVNGEGIRQDVADWITKQSYTGDLPKAAAQLAKAYQGVLTVAVTDDAAVRAADSGRAEWNPRPTDAVPGFMPGLRAATNPSG